MRLAGPGGCTRCILISMMSSLVTACCFFLAGYIEDGEFPEPLAPVVIIATLSFPVSLAVGVPFLASRQKKAKRDGG